MNKDVEKLVEILPNTTVSHNFICGTWLPGLYYGNDWFRAIEQDTYFEKYKAVIHKVLNRPNCYVNAAVLKEDHDTVLAYAVIEHGATLHWVYTKPAWRKCGLAKSLIPPTIAIVTNLTKVGRSLKPQTWKFDPFL